MWTHNFREFEALFSNGKWMAQETRVGKDENRKEREKKKKYERVD